ncbi:hypothetical protein FOA52_010686 [Chlamydomonas sp. UWO 241]|nr:hypothetical protein FOA52_010686 [Chlamydomonas sp. UWO 241]
MDPNAMLAAMAAIPGVTLVNPTAGVAGAAAVPGAPIDPNAPNPATRRAREIYVGNLAVGILTPELTRELFNTVLAPFCHDPVAYPPVIECKVDMTTGRFAFLEIRTEQLAANLLELDKMEVAGRSLKIGRPKGYEEQFGKLMVTPKLNLAQTFAAQLSGAQSNVVMLENLTNAKLMLDPAERREIYDDVYAEAAKCGGVVGVAVPVPSTAIGDDVPNRVLIKYRTAEDAKTCFEMMNGRDFDDHKVTASYSNEYDFSRAQQGEWVEAAPEIQRVNLMNAALSGVAPPMPPPGAPPPGMALPGPPPVAGMTQVNIPGLPPISIPVLAPLAHNAYQPQQY